MYTMPAPSKLMVQANDLLRSQWATLSEPNNLHRRSDEMLGMLRSMQQSPDYYGDREVSMMLQVRIRQICAMDVKIAMMNGAFGVSFDAPRNVPVPAEEAEYVESEVVSYADDEQEEEATAPSM